MRIELRIGEGAQCRRQQLECDGEYGLGSSADNAVCIALATVSRQHAQLRIGANGELALRDLGSRNGTFLDATRLVDDHWHSLPVGGLVRLGSVPLRVQVLSAGDEDLALELTPEQPLRPRTGPVDVTLAASVVDRFTRKALPQLLRQAAARAPKEVLARALGEAFMRYLPLASLSIGAQARPVELWFSALIEGEPGLVAEHGETRIELTLKPGQQSGPYLQLAELADALITLAAPRRAPDDAADSIRWPRPEPIDPAVRKLYRQAARIAAGDVHVLIRGESGTGKELFAEFVHAHSADPHSADPDAPFIAVNCAALPDDLLEAELFGVEKGVATGVEARPGVFERAHGGTLFLDEIGDMAAATQARILRVLQEQQVWRLGASRARPAKVRVISATHRDLAAMRHSGEFRDDLWHRIADWEVELPPLRDRQADIGNLALHFLAQAAAERGIAVRGITRLALQQLCAYDWPGNIRELQREMKRAAVFLDHQSALSSAELRTEIRSARSGVVGQSLAEQVQRAERRIIDRAIANCDGDIDLAAEQLGVSRATLYRRLADRERSS